MPMGMQVAGGMGAPPQMGTMPGFGGMPTAVMANVNGVPTLVQVKPLI